MFAKRLINCSARVFKLNVNGFASLQSSITIIPAKCNLIQAKRYFLFESYLNAVFNKYDESRVDAVGPDRACAEWLLRVGAAVKWKDRDIPLVDYNSLPVGEFRTLLVEAIDATDSGIMEAGFPYLEKLQHFRKIKLRNCKYCTNATILGLSHHAADKIEWMEISFTGDVTDGGIKHLINFPNLKYLRLEHLPGVDRPEEVLKYLQDHLPNCEVDYVDIQS